MPGPRLAGPRLRRAGGRRALGRRDRAPPTTGAPLPDGGATVASGVAMLRATLAYRDGDLSAAEALGAQAVELEAEPDSPWRAVALATLGAARHFRGARPEEVAALLEEAVAIARAGANSMAVLRAQGTLAAVALAAGDLDGARAVGGRRRRAARAAVPGGVLDGLAGDRRRRASSPPTRASSSAARERLERAVVLARRGAARPEHIYALAALAPMQATLGDADAAAATLRERAARAARRRRARACSRTCSTTSSAACAAGRRERRAEVEELSAREMSVLRLLGSELSIAEIGEELFISRNTVKTHVRGIYRKLDADDARRRGRASRARALRRVRRERPVDAPR